MKCLVWFHQFDGFELIQAAQPIQTHFHGEHVSKRSLHCYYILCFSFCMRRLCHCYFVIFCSSPVRLSLFTVHIHNCQHYCSTLLNECDFVSYCFSMLMLYTSWLTVYTYHNTIRHRTLFFYAIDTICVCVYECCAPFILFVYPPCAVSVRSTIVKKAKSRRLWGIFVPLFLDDRCDAYDYYR